MLYVTSSGLRNQGSVRMTSHSTDQHRAYLERSLGAHAAYTLHYHLV